MQVTKRFWKACTILALFRDDNDYSRISLVQLLSQSHWRRANARNASFFTLHGGQFTFSTQLLTPNHLLYSPTDAAPVSLETHPHPPTPHSDFASFCLSVCLSVCFQFKKLQPINLKTRWWSRNSKSFHAVLGNKMWSSLWSAVCFYFDTKWLLWLRAK